MTPVVEFEAVHKRYGKVEALRGLDLAVREGEIVALLGPNGAGKTTAVSLMLGLRRPTSGRVRLFGMDPTARRARSRCGVILQESGVPGALTVREVVDLFRSYYLSPLPTERAIALAGLQEKATSRVARLSGGERQRLYHALAICGDPHALFLDEPTVGMDVEARRLFLTNLRDFAASGKTILLTTHYIEEADQLARRVVVIDRGAVIADATPSDIKARSRAKRVSFRTAGPQKRGTFEGLPVEGLVIDGCEVRFFSNEPERVLRALSPRGVSVVDLQVLGATLEDALLGLTMQQGRDDEHSKHS